MKKIISLCLTVLLLLPINTVAKTLPETTVTSEFINEDETSSTKNQKDNISNSDTIFDNMEKDFNQFIDNANHFIENYKQSHKS